MALEHDIRNPAPVHVIEYELPGGWRVLVGKTDADNDRLSLHIARQNDYWFHARGVPGSHVVLRAGETREPGKETLKAAAAIAAWHSKAKDGGVTAVSCVPARFVSKPRGAKPGTVTIRKETVLMTRPGVEHAKKLGARALVPGHPEDPFNPSREE